jgi:DinB superfamily
MRWKPETDRCPECDFNFSVASADAISLVANSPTPVATLFKGSEEETRRPSQEVWSPSGYLWHLVDVLRIGSDRLLTATIDPAAGIPCWDENALAEVRQYERLSPRVAVVAYEAAASAWVAVANLVPMDASVEHPEFGSLTAEDIIRRNAHEVQHHLLDIRRGL